MSKPVVHADGVGIRFTLSHGRSPLSNLCRRLFGSDDSGAGSLWALRNITFSVDEGEILGIIGRNGAGKSTLFLLLSQILEADEGTLTINGKISTLLTIGAGFRPDLTGRENLYLSASLLGLSKHEIAGVEADIIEFAELQTFIDEPIKTYSAGMNARLGFSIAVHVNPDILLMDEVLSVGDESFRAKSKARIHRLLGSARAILIVSHNLAFIEEYCSRVLWIEDGEVRECGNPAETVAAYREFSTEMRRRIDAAAESVDTG